MTTNNAPETIASNDNNNNLRTPAAFTSRIPSPKAWTSYTFKQRNIPEETQLPTRANNDHEDRQGAHVPPNGGPPSGGSSHSSNGNDHGRRPNPNPNGPNPPHSWYKAPRGNGNGGGGGGSGGGKGGGGGGGGGEGGDNRNQTSQDPNTPPWWRTPEEWQINHKLNSTVLPEWNGAGETAIDYLSAMGFLAGLSSKMKEGIAQLAPFKWTSYAKSWWETLPSPDRGYFSTNWDNMMIGIRAHFLDEEWVRDRTFEFDEMTFRNKGHEQESPLEYIQRRIRHHHFLHPDEVDGATTVARILRRQPVEWSQYLNETICPTIIATQSVAKKMKNSLMASWQQTERNRRPAPFYRNNRSRVAHAAEVEPNSQGTILETYSSDEEEDEDRSVNFVNNSNRKPNSKPSQSGGQKDTTKMDFPHGKTMNGVSFERDDTRVSSKPPHGDCYICTSPKHFHRDCPHYGKLNALRNTHLIHVDWDPNEEEEADRMYLVMLAETKTTISAYQSEDMLKQFALDIHNSQGNIKRILAATKREIPAAETREEIHLPRDLPESNLHRVYPTHRNERKNKGKQRELSAANSVTERTSSKTNKHIYEPGKVFPAAKGRSLPEGMGSLGSKALHMRARIHKLNSDDVKARLDSGADITLISEDFWKTMTDPPRLREGMRMKLYHLTGGAKVLGYIKTELYATAQDESIVSFELEAYVVRNMNVPLLLGEDFPNYVRTERN